MAVKDKLISNECLKAVNDSMQGQVSDLKSAITENKTNSYNLFNKYSTPLTTTGAKIINNDGNLITIASTNNSGYISDEFFIDVTNIASIVPTFEIINGTGSGFVRIGWSSDGVSHGGWITHAVSGTPVDVSAYNYITVALYAVYETNAGAGHYTTYKDVQVVAGTEAKHYLPHSIVEHTPYDAENELLSQNVGTTYNIFDPKFRQTTTETVQGDVNNNTITVKQTSAGTYKYAEFIIDVRNYDKVRISYKIKESTGYAVVRYGYSNDGYARAAWVNALDESGKIIDVSSYTYITLALYNALDESQAANSYTIYQDVIIQDYCNDYPYVLPEGIRDNESRGLIRYLYEQTYPTASDFYYGERIILGSDSRQQKCNRSIWREYKKADIADLENYELYKNQALAYYGDYMFLLQDGGGIVIVDYDTKAIVANTTAPVTTNNHQNSAQFSNIFYDISDAFPLLFVSQCGGDGKDDCLIYRIAQSGQTFSVSLVNKISVDYTTHTGSWAIDNNTGCIAFIGYRAGDYTVTSNNPVDIAIWNLPNKADIVSGDTITLNLNDAKSYLLENNYVIVQSAYGAYGKIYMPLKQGSTGNDWRINVYDMNTGKLIAHIPMPYGAELEGIAEIDAKLYVSKRDGTDTTGVNPVTIYEISRLN